MPENKLWVSEQGSFELWHDGGQVISRQVLLWVVHYNPRDGVTLLLLSVKQVDNYVEVPSRGHTRIWKHVI